MQYDDLVFILDDNNECIEDLVLRGEIDTDPEDFPSIVVHVDYNSDTQLSPYCKTIKKALDFFLFRENHKLDYSTKLLLKQKLEDNPTYTNYLQLLVDIGTAVETELGRINMASKDIIDLRMFRKVLYAVLPNMLEGEVE